MVTLFDWARKSTPLFPVTAANMSTFTVLVNGALIEEPLSDSPQPRVP